MSGLADDSEQACLHFPMMKSVAINHAVQGSMVNFGLSMSDNGRSGKGLTTMSRTNAATLRKARIIIWEMNRRGTHERRMHRWTSKVTVW